MANATLERQVVNDLHILKFTWDKDNDPNVAFGTAESSRFLNVMDGPCDVLLAFVQNQVYFSTTFNPHYIYLFNQITEPDMDSGDTNHDEADVLIEAKAATSAPGGATIYLPGYTVVPFGLDGGGTRFNVGLGVVAAANEDYGADGKELGGDTSGSGNNAGTMVLTLYARKR